MARMFSLKKYKPMNEYSDEWSVAQGMHEGSPMYVRFRSSLKEAAGHPEYPFQIGIAVPLIKPTQAGLPTESEMNILSKIEDKLVDALKEHAVLTLSISTGGMREFIFYANKWQPEEFEEIVSTTNKLFASHTLQFMIQHDPKWKLFKSFV